MLALLLALTVQIQDPSAADGIAVLHRGRPKPLDSFAREFMHEISGSAKFRGYKDPDGKYVQVFEGGKASLAVLTLMALPPETVRNLRFIRIDHLKLKEEMQLPAKQLYFSLKDLEPHIAQLEKEARAIDPDAATVAERAKLQIYSKHWMVEDLAEERLFAVVPIPFGDQGAWMTPSDVRAWLEGRAQGNPRYDAVRVALEAYVAKDASARSRLESVIGSLAALLRAVAAGDGATFARLGGALPEELRSLNPGVYPSAKVISTELTYNGLHPFGWAALALAFSAFAYLMAYSLRSTRLWAAGLTLQIGALAMQLLGYGLRWYACGHYPLSNHYESMMMMAVAATAIPIVFELFMRKSLIGMAGGIAAAVLVLLADNVYQFASQSFINPLQPALMNTVWMMIHVPTIMSAFACALILAILGHVYLFTYLKRPGDVLRLEEVHACMVRVLQVTVLLLIGGTILGAVWAGEAWGRPWGWDMKEVWALITCLVYLAMMHARFAGAIKGFGGAIWAVAGFLSVVLCYYGVNFVFGSGLHSYGFGSGESVWMILPVIVFYGLEGLLIATAVGRRLAEKRAKRGPTIDELAERKETP